MKPGPDGRLYAINPENGYFGVAPGTNYKSNPNAMETIKRDTIYTNVALTPDLRRLVGRQRRRAARAMPRLEGQPVDAGLQGKSGAPQQPLCRARCATTRCSRPKSTTPRACPSAPSFSAAAAPTTMPLIFQAFNWIHGVYIGATHGLGNDRRRQPGRWPSAPRSDGHAALLRLQHGRLLPALAATCASSSPHPPRIFHVNWFRKDEEGTFLWPGFGENMRVLKWIVDRCHGRAGAIESPLGWLPDPKSFDLTGMKNFGPAELAKVQSINVDEWRREALSIDELFFKLYSDLPKELTFQRELLVSRL